MTRRAIPAMLTCGVILAAPSAWPDMLPSRGAVDSRIRVAIYNSDEVYRLYGRIGYQIDLQFEPGEVFVGLGAGDLEGLAFSAQDNHLFLKPKAVSVNTNLTVLTSRRQYHFDYVTIRKSVAAGRADAMYALRFTYPPLPASKQGEAAARVDGALGTAGTVRSRNSDYWYCGDATLKPAAAWDDGVRTWLRFDTHAELPAIFVGTAEGGESLVNFSIDSGDVVIQRIAPRFSLRRGRLSGCVVNKSYAGSGVRLSSGTVSPAVERVTQDLQP